MSTKLTFNLTFKEQSVEVIDGNGGHRILTLRELDGVKRDAYLDAMSKRMKFEKGQPAGLSSFAGMQAHLVSLSLFDEKGTNVPQTEIEKWPASVQSALYEAAQELSGLNKKEEKEKNDSPASA